MDTIMHIRPRVDGVEEGGGVKIPKMECTLYVLNGRPFYVTIDIGYTEIG